MPYQGCGECGYGYIQCGLLTKRDGKYCDIVCPKCGSPYAVFVEDDLTEYAAIEQMSCPGCRNRTMRSANHRYDHFLRAGELVDLSLHTLECQLCHCRPEVTFDAESRFFSSPDICEMEEALKEWCRRQGKIID